MRLSSRSAALVSSTFCAETPPGGATSTVSVSFKPLLVANFESTFCDRAIQSIRVSATCRLRRHMSEGSALTGAGGVLPLFLKEYLPASKVVGTTVAGCLIMRIPAAATYYAFSARPRAAGLIASGRSSCPACLRLALPRLWRRPWGRGFRAPSRLSFAGAPFRNADHWSRQPCMGLSVSTIFSSSVSLFDPVSVSSPRSALLLSRRAQEMSGLAASWRPRKAWP